MEDFVEILKYTIPALIVLLTSWLLLKSFFENYTKNNSNELRMRMDELRIQLKHEDKRMVTPIRLQAYERVILFCERINPQSLVFRTKKPGQSNVQLQSALLKAIRDEAEHNYSQQLYINPKTWKLVQKSKDETIKLINEASTKVDPKSEATEISKAIFELQGGIGKAPTEKAIEQLKADVQKYF